MSDDKCVICLMPALNPVRLTCQCTMRACASCLFRWMRPANNNTASSYSYSGTVPKDRACPTCRRKDVELLVIDNATGDTKPLTIREMAARGDKELVENMIQLGALWFAAPDECGVTPLGAAAAAGHLDIVKLFVEEWFISVDEADDNGETPLFAACYAGHFEVAKYLLEKGADPMHCDTSSWYPVSAAAYGGHLEIVKLLVESGFVDLNKCVNESQETAAHEAAQMGHYDVVKYLLQEAQNPIPPDALDNTKTSILHCALSAAPKNRNKLGGGKNKSKSKRNQTPEESEQLPLYLIDTFGDRCLPQQRNKYGESALHVAVENGYFIMARRLIESYGLDPNEKDDDGNNAAARATSIAWRQTEVGRLVDFLDYLHSTKKTDLKTVRDDLGRNMLQYGCGRLKRVAEFLVDTVGMDPADVGPDDVTALYFVVGEGNLDTVEYLESKLGEAATAAAYAKDCYDPTMDGNTMLHQAVKSQKEAMIRRAVAKCPPNFINKGNACGRTALMDVCDLRTNNQRQQQGTTDLVADLMKLLLSLGADPTITDEDGNSVISEICASNSVHAVDRLKLILATSSKDKTTNKVGEKPSDEKDDVAKDKDTGAAKEEAAPSSAAAEGEGDRAEAAATEEAIDVDALLSEMALENLLYKPDSEKDTPFHKAIQRVQARRKAAIEYNKVRREERRKERRAAAKREKRRAQREATGASEEDDDDTLNEDDDSDNEDDDDDDDDDDDGKLDVEAVAMAMVNYLLSLPRCTPEYIMTVNSDKDSILHTIAGAGDVDLFRFMVNKLPSDVQINPNRYGNLPLHCAADYGNYHMARYLFEQYPLDFMIMNKKKKTPKDIAVEEKYAEISELFPF